jgi:subtilisin
MSARYIILSVLVLAFSACATKPLGPMAELKAKGFKRYVVWNKKQFLKAPGVSTLSLSTVNALGFMGARNITSMGRINGFTYEVDATAAQDLQGPITALGAEWMVTPEVEYHTMDVVELKPYTCPVSTTPVCPVCPGNPNPTDPTEFTDDVPWSVAQVHAPEAQRIANGSGVTVCLLDTGVDKNHPDLQGVIAGGISMLGGDYQDDQGHGTHCAGIIAANANNAGIRGNSRAKIYAIKVLDRNGSGSTAAIAQGIVEAPKHGCKIISMSLGSTQSDAAMLQAVRTVKAQGVMVVAAAGNSGGAVGYPAAYPEVISVSSMNQAKQLSSFSSRGKVEFAGYGESILSLRLGGGTTTMSGTSMACPQVAGVLALALSAGKTTMKADNIGLPASMQGAGLVNALATVQ